MLHVALWEPEIPPNTGNVARLCAATGARLHLIGRLGFRLDDRSLKRAGIDYWDAVDVVRHVTFEEFEEAFFGDQSVMASPASQSRHRGLSPPCVPDGGDKPRRSLWCIETSAERLYTQADFADGDCLLFGGESKGLPPGVRERYSATLVGIPMPTGKVRSLNLATAVGVVLYEALRQLHDW
jgi:tRNA (cytidine/uridine-2'-O-)-methyltransferase